MVKNTFFTYKAKDANMHYELDPRGYLNHLTVQLEGHNKVVVTNNSEVILDVEGDVSWKIKDQKINRDTLFISYLAQGKNFKQQFDTWYTIKQKSLICGINEIGETGMVSEIKLGTTDASDDAKLVAIPILNYNYKERPNLLYSDDLFYFTMFDWYYSNASSFFAGRPKIKKGQAAYNGGVKYIPLINGKKKSAKRKIIYQCITRCAGGISNH